MLNTFKIGGNSATVSFNSPSTGIIQKSHSKSRFIKCHAKSVLADEIMGYKNLKPFIEVMDKKIEITVLQAMIFGDNELLVEIVNNDDLKEEIK